MNPRGTCCVCRRGFSGSDLYHVALDTLVCRHCWLPALRTLSAKEAVLGREFPVRSVVDAMALERART